MHRTGVEKGIMMWKWAQLHGDDEHSAHWHTKAVSPDQQFVYTA